MEQRMKQNGIVNVIEYDEDNETLVWKYPVDHFFQLPFDTEKTFHSEVYYINLAKQMGIK